MKNIVILAAGPAKKGRNRHLELYLNEHIIDRVIRSCTADNTNLYVVVDSKNTDLINHLGDRVNILHPKDEKIYSTFEVALSMEGDCIMVLGDLINLRTDDIERFINSEYRSATCQYMHPWGAHIPSVDRTLLRRSDCGDCISMIAQEHKAEFLGDKNYKQLFHKFYPSGNQYNGMNENWYNDVGTFLSYSFFFDIWSNPGWTPKNNEKGAILFQHPVYKDND